MLDLGKEITISLTLEEFYEVYCSTFKVFCDAKELYGDNLDLSVMDKALDTLDYYMFLFFGKYYRTGSGRFLPIPESELHVYPF